MPVLSIIVPAYQEEATIGPLLERVAAIDLERLGYAREILVCDDGSRDATASLVAEFADGRADVKLLQHAENRGKGAAIRTALAEAEGDYVLIQDADLEYEVSDYPVLLNALGEGVPVVYGSRFLDRSWPSGMRPSHWLANRLLTLSTNVLYGLGISDEATCYKIFRTDLLRSLNLECNGFEFCPEVTAKLGRRGVPISEVPVSYTARAVAAGKKVRWTDGLKAVWELVRWRFSRRSSSG